MIYKTLHRRLNIEKHQPNLTQGCCGRGCIVVGFTTTYGSSAYHH